MNQVDIIPTSSFRRPMLAYDTDARRYLLNNVEYIAASCTKLNSTLKHDGVPQPAVLMSVLHVQCLRHLQALRLESRALYPYESPFLSLN